MDILKTSVFALMLMLALPALAVEKVTAEKIGLPPTNDIVLDKKPDPIPLDKQAQLLCEAHRIMSSYADPNYKAGVDAYGRPVVPADGGAAQSGFSVPEEIEIPISIDFAKYMNFTKPTGTELNGQVGSVIVKTDGTVLYNGQNAANQLQDFCKTVTIEPELKFPGGKSE